MAALTSMRRVTIVLGCVGLWIAAVIAMRAYEVAPQPEPFDVPAYRASLTESEKNDRARMLKAAAAQFRNTHLSWQVRMDPTPQRINYTEVKQGSKQWNELSHDLKLVNVNGWHSEFFSPKFSAQLETMSREEWFAQVVEASRRPAGPVEDFSRATRDNIFVSWVWIDGLASVINARAFTDSGKGRP
jgi:hypothetical protein